MSEQQWEPPLIELSADMSSYVLWLIARDLDRWSSERRSRLSREEATSMALFLASKLPPELRTEVPAMPAVPPALKVS